MCILDIFSSSLASTSPSDTNPPKTVETRRGILILNCLLLCHITSTHFSYSEHFRLLITIYSILYLPQNKLKWNKEQVMSVCTSTVRIEDTGSRQLSLT